MGEPLIDHRDHTVRAQVVFRHVAALYAIACASSRGIPGNTGCWLASTPAVGHALSRERTIVGPCHRQRRRRGHGFDTRQLAHLIDGAANQPQPAVEIGKGAEAQLNARGDKTRRIETNAARW